MITFNQYVHKIQPISKKVSNVRSVWTLLQSIMINLNPFLEFCKEERAFVKLVENAEKTISQIQLMLQREENVKAILQKYKVGPRVLFAI